MTQPTFRQRYDDLQNKWRQFAISHDDYYLQYLPPSAPVDFILVGKMTSIDEKAASNLSPGKYPNIETVPFNLYATLGDWVLNYGAHRHLCKPGETYYLTDLAKCAIPPKLAKGKHQEKKFSDWYPLLLEELKLVTKPKATVIPIGSATSEFLRRQENFPYPLTDPILHWSRAAVAAAKMASSFFPHEWKEFKGAAGWEDLRASIEQILAQADLSQHMDAVQKFEGKFTEMYLHYMFTYKKEFPLRRQDVSETCDKEHA